MNGLPKQIIATEDGSHTVAIPALGLSYHSNRGAIQESQHVFIEAGLMAAQHQFPEGLLKILEMGFGTGLNALLTLIEANKTGRTIHYTTIEQYPMTAEEAAALNYTHSLGHGSFFKTLHQVPWNAPLQEIAPQFLVQKVREDLLNARLEEKFHVIYFDAFAPDAQPALWSEAVFKMLLGVLVDGGILTTYCSKSSVRRAMVAAGFTVKKIPGPRGKREMIQAFKRSPVKGK